MLKDIFYSNKYDSNIFIKNENKAYTLFEIKNLIKTRCTEIKEKPKNVVIFEDDNFSFIINFFASIFTEKTIYLLDSKQKISNLDFEYFLLNKEINNKKSDYEFGEIDFDYVNINFYTSGSTSKPKIFKKSINNLLYEARDNKEEFKIKENNLEFITTTILQHLFSLTFFLMFPLVNIDKNYIINTNKIYYPDNIDTDNSVLVSTPVFLETIKKFDINLINPPKYIISAGSKLDNDIFSYLEKYSNIIEIYGSTETGVVAHKTKSNENLIIFKNVKVNKSGDKTIVKSAYFPEDFIEINDELEIKGSELFFKKRKDNVLKIYDKRIYSDEIEEILNKNENILKSYCFKCDEKLACFAVLSEAGKEYLIKYGISRLKTVLKKYLKGKFDIVPQKWRFGDTMPVNIRGKINKEYIEELFNINFSFPVVLDRKMSEDLMEFKLFIDKSSNFFDGHFPEFPIVPGVAQLYLAEFFIKHYLSSEIHFEQIKKIKFSNIIKPDSIVYLKLEKNNGNIKFEYHNQKTYSCAIFIEDNKTKEEV